MSFRNFLESMREMQGWRKVLLIAAWLAALIALLFVITLVLEELGLGFST